MFASFGLSVLLCIPFLVILEPTALLYAGILSGHVLVSVLIFRYSRALFLAVDYYLDPGVPAGGGDDRGGVGVPERPTPTPGSSRRLPDRGLRASRRERKPVAVR